MRFYFFCCRSLTTNVLHSDLTALEKYTNPFLLLLNFQSVVEKMHELYNRMQ